jgi:membrane protease YdiL (CAAX protease family)
MSDAPSANILSPRGGGGRKLTKMDTESPATNLSPGAADGYWAESRQPLTSLAFIAPLLALYELGVVALRVQNGADAWMRKVLNVLGFGQHFLLPLVTIGILLAWQHLTHRPWRFSAPVLLGMAVECLLLAIVLRLILHLQGSLLQAIAGPSVLEVGAAGTEAVGLREAVGYLGAGIYEELLFRLVLLSLVLWVLRRAGVEPRASLIAAVLLTSLLFAVAHHVGPYGEEFRWFYFLFRFLAGVFFSILFVFRGFGIAAGTHALYDILVSAL